MSAHASIDEVAADERLVERIKRGDESAFERLFRLSYTVLVNVVLRYVDNRADAEDVVTELLVRIWERRDHWDVNGPVMSYLFRAARNGALNWRKMSHRREKRHAHVNHLLGEDPAMDEVDPLLAIDAQHLSVQVRESLHALSPRGREVFLLVWRHGLSVRETAAALGVTPATVQTQLARALAALRRVIVGQ